MTPDNRLIIIGLAGEAGVGKDASANILVAQHGFMRVALADGIKSAWDDMDGPTRVFTKELTEAGKSPRWGWQQLGTEAREQCGLEDIWIDLLRVKLTYAAFIHPRPRYRFVIPDVSFPHESQWLAQHVAESDLLGIYKTWRIIRPGHNPIADQHASEEGRRTIDADWIVNNDSSMNWLTARLNYALETMLNPIPETDE